MQSTKDTSMDQEDQDRAAPGLQASRVPAKGKAKDDIMLRVACTVHTINDGQQV